MYNTKNKKTGLKINPNKSSEESQSNPV